jgi:hypothetical protein
MKISPNLRTQVLKELREVESDVSKPHKFDFYLYVPTEEAARAAKKKLVGDFDVQIQEAALGPGWLCLSRATLIPESAPLEKIGIRFKELAVEFAGEFDGWEAETVLEG